MAETLSSPPVTVSVAAPSLVAIAASIPGRARTEAALAARYGGPAPATGRSLATADGRLAGTGAGRWQLIGAAGDGWRLEGELQAALGDGALVTDQSDARVGFVLEAASAPALLGFMEKACTLDLDPAVFPPGSAALTEVAGVGALLLLEAPARLLVAVPRSFAESFAELLAGMGAGRG